MNILPIISLTSYPPRIKTAHLTISSLLKQNYPYKKIVLWLSKYDFPAEENSLTPDILELVGEKFTIKWCENLFSYKKLIPSLQNFPEDLIAICDDDALYPEDWLKDLVETYIKYPNCVIAKRAHQLLKRNGKILSYNTWNQLLTWVAKPEVNLVPTGLGGVLYSLNNFYNDIFDKDIYLKYFKTTDDIWFWAMAVLKGTKIMLSDKPLNNPKLIENSQAFSLYALNVHGGANDKALDEIFKIYPRLNTIIQETKYRDYINIKATKYNKNLHRELMMSKSSSAVYPQIQGISTFPYDKILKSIPNDHCQQMTKKGFLKELFNKNEKKIFIDLGCGNCNLFNFIKKHYPDFDYIGVDIIDSPESQIPKVADCTFMPYNGVNLPFEDRSVDIIYMNQVLEHIRAPHLLLPEIGRVLKDDGICCGSASQLEPFHSNSIFNWTYYGLASFFDLFNLHVYKLRPGIDSRSLISRHLNLYTLKRNHEFEDIFFLQESPLNYKLDKWGEKCGMSNQGKNLLKLTYAGHVFFAATKADKKSSQPKFNSANYWESRYSKGGNSGAGSYGRLAVFKAEIINNFIRNHDINSVIEFGCGDGNQLKLYDFKHYTGYDISPTIVNHLINSNKNPNYTFKLLQDYDGQQADLTLSIDVLFHLIESDVFYSYLRRLFRASSNYVIIYSPDKESTENYGSHVKLRSFTTFIKSQITDFKFLEYIPNKYPWNPKDPNNTSFCDFYIYQRV